MASYQDLKHYSDLKPTDPRYEPEKASWIAEGLLRLRAQIRDSALGQRKAGNLVIGSWNIRAFDDGRPRRDESYHYIAEIIDHFDICAVQEIKDDLGPLKRLVALLGPNWDYFVTDVTSGSAGNSERQAFLFNTNKVQFRNLVGEVVLDDKNLLKGKQFARTPFFASFQADWFKFTLMSVHIIFAGTKPAEKKMRAAEVRALAKIAAKRAKKDDQVYVMIGDMNVDATDDAIMAGMTDNHMIAPVFGPTNLKGTKFFDQIAFTSRPKKTRLVQSGSIDWRGSVFRPEDKDHYEPVATAARDGQPYKNWNTSYENSFMSFEMSDHLPIWVEIETDYSDEYLERFVE